MYAEERRGRDYWDSNVWVAYLRKGEDPHYDACRQLFDDLHDGKRTVVVSALVVGEVLQVSRREAARSAAKEYGGDTPNLQVARDMADEAADTLFQQLGRLSDTGRIVVRRPSKNAGRYASLALRMLIRHKGRFDQHGKMGIIYRNLGMLDMMHALAARDYRVKNFCTRDRQFGALASDPRFDGINFVIL